MHHVCIFIFLNYKVYLDFMNIGFLNYLFLFIFYQEIFTIIINSKKFLLIRYEKLYNCYKNYIISLLKFDFESFI